MTSMATYAASDDPTYNKGIINTIITTTTGSGYWLDGVWYPVNDWYPQQPLVVQPLTVPQVLPTLSPEQYQQILDTLMGLKAKAAELEPPKEEKAAPEPAQEAENPIKPVGRKLNLDD